MSIFDLLFGKPLATSAEKDEHIGVAAGVPIFGLDGLTSAAYGPEAAMVLLIPLGMAGVQQHLLPIFAAILTLLVILYFSYRQTIDRVSDRRRVIHGGQRKSRRQRRFAGCRGADDRLHPDGGGRVSRPA